MLPFCKLVLQAQKSLSAGYPTVINTIGDHIKKRRLDLKLSQCKLGKLFGVSSHSVSDWEANIASPNVSLIPKVIEFLGYVPFGNLDEMSEGERIRTCRKLLGLTRKEAAKRLGVSISTLLSWENGNSIKKDAHWLALKSFFATASCSYDSLSIKTCFEIHNKKRG